ncbi:nucleotidyltransferase domain-containing protein [Pseudactinotalea sp.]|uniref:nucleotidyltransferase domain-containing protein n=1 Tax=Pseudactinotalea sp. TaxID=1926260 RepID=UPI003B3A12C0
MEHTAGPMRAALLTDLLDSLQQATIPVWLGGGWGIDALIGEQTREHRDADLMYPIEHDAELRRLLTETGYRVETDWWPVRVEWAGRSYVDVHPLRFDPEGSAVQAGLDEAEFHYPASAFVHGTIAGRDVGCLSIEQQRLFHSGYPLRAVDRHDLAQLHRFETGTAPPRVVLTCGPAGAGKSTYAKSLEQQGFTRLSFDESAWARGLRHHPLPDADGAALHADLQRRLLELVTAGDDVVVDSAFVTPESRQIYRDLLAPLGVEPVVHLLHTPRELVLQRLRERRGEHPHDVVVPIDRATSYYDDFPTPTLVEGPMLIVNGDADPSGTFER